MTPKSLSAVVDLCLQLCAAPYLFLAFPGLFWEGQRVHQRHYIRAVLKLSQAEWGSLRTRMGRLACICARAKIVLQPSLPLQCSDAEHVLLIGTLRTTKTSNVPFTYCALSQAPVLILQPQGKPPAVRYSKCDLV